MKTEFVTVSQATPVYAAMRLMIDQNTTGLPVVGEGMKLEGMISEQDMLALLSQSSDVDMSVRDIMSHDVISLDAETKLQDVCIAMVEHKVRKIPIVTDGVLVGIISRRDIIKCLLQQRQAH